MSSGVEFETDKAQYGTRPSSGGNFASGGSFGGSGNEPKMIQWLMRKGIVKSPRAGQVALFALVIVNLVITYIAITYFL